MKKINSIEYIIFDMDGTLYSFKEGSFSRSGLRKEVLKRAGEYISAVLGQDKKNAESILKKITEEYKEDISIALEKEYGLDRYDYFNKVWDIPAKTFITPNSTLKNTLRVLAGKYQFILVSDAPRIWIQHVLKELGVEKYFENKKIFSGEGNFRKEFHNAYQMVMRQFGQDPKKYIAVGDQEETDIMTAREIGMPAVLVKHNAAALKSAADYTIKKLSDLPDVAEKIEAGG